MSSQDETVAALTAFYQQIIKHLSLNESDLVFPPETTGWETLDMDKLGTQAKSESVLAILRRMPYLVRKEGGGIIVNCDTVAISYVPGSRHGGGMERIYPLPSHCVYLTEGVAQCGYSIILDTKEGTITAWSIQGIEITLPNEEYEAVSQEEEWRCHATAPAAELLHKWTEKYARLFFMIVPSPPDGEFVGSICNGVRDATDQIASENGPFLEWHPDEDELQNHAGGIEHAPSRQLKIDQYLHETEVYNCFVRNGWPSAFDKPTCRLEVIELMKHLELKEQRFHDITSLDPVLSSAVFDEDKAKAEIEQLWLPKHLKERRKDSRMPSSLRPRRK